MFGTILCTFLSVACTISAISWYVLVGSALDTVSGDSLWLLPIIMPFMYSQALLIYTVTLSPEKLKARSDKIYILHSISQIFCTLTIDSVASFAIWVTSTELFSYVEPLAGKAGKESCVVIWVVWLCGLVLFIVFPIGAVVYSSWMPYIERGARYSENGWRLEFEIFCVPFQNIKVRSPRHFTAEEEQTGHLLEKIPTETSKLMKEDV
ncbi:hypothetical protein EAF00_006185 [Botryotinia globosa]|nr:hypothetical protein EAF00_006185 [Botryotinia globosa]